MDFFKKYIEINLNDYKNIGIDLEINKLLLLITLGIMIASVLVNYNRHLVSLLVKKLTRYKATSEAGAKTLKDLGLDSNRGVRRLVESNGRVGKLIAVIGEEKLTYEEYVARQKAKKSTRAGCERYKLPLYIADEDSCARIAQAPAPTLVSTLLFAVMIAAIYVCIALLMPEILTLINNMLAL